MKIPESPPDTKELISKLIRISPEEFTNILTAGIQPDHGGKYYHWDNIKHIKPPKGMNNEQWWLALKTARRPLYKNIPHKDKNNMSFVYAEPDMVRKQLHEIDMHGGCELKASAQVANPQTRDSYLINSLIEEAITSSQLEGAATTRKVAKEMLRQKREPRDKSEKMIFNNYNAMEFIREIANEELTPGIILELHKILTIGTLDDSSLEGKLRKSNDIFVGDVRDNTIIHIPPKASSLKNRVNSLCDFANSSDKTFFTHPVIRAIILHFLLAYDHPFEDGNGRTARALFYWSMLKQGYWTMEFISISSILRKAPSRYIKSYLHTETDENDVTYFIIFQLEVINRAILSLLEHLNNKAREMQNVEQLIKSSSKLQKQLNHRQLALINRALKQPDSVYYIQSHKNSNNITYQTARTDLLKLEELGLFEKSKHGSAFVFRSVSDLKNKLTSMR